MPKAKLQNKYLNELVDLLLKIRNRDLLLDFLIDLLSPAELAVLSVRWQIVKQLDRGISQRQIAQNFKLGVGTVTRGSRELLDKKGGFRRILDKFYKKK